MKYKLRYTYRGVLSVIKSSVFCALFFLPGYLLVALFCHFSLKYFFLNAQYKTHQ